MPAHAYGVRTFLLAIFIFSSFLPEGKNEENIKIARRKVRGAASPRYLIR
jgi:hypothetical protein